MKVNDQYLTNVLLKINAKLGGLNSKLSIEHSLSIPFVSKVPTLILGMDVSHGSPGQFNVPSVAAFKGLAADLKVQGNASYSVAKG